MPRPERVKLRAQQTAAAKAAEPPAEDGQDQPEIDTGEQQVQSSRSGHISEEELTLSRQVAKRLGWVPKEEWTRDPAKWTEADAFLERTPEEISTLRERLRRTGQVAAEQAQEAANTARQEALAELRAAAAAGNEEGAVAAGQKLVQTQPHPETAAWTAKNPWFYSDDEAQAIAVTAIRKAEKGGAGVRDALSAGEAAVKRLFPDYFEETRREPAPKPQTPPLMAGGSRGTTIRASVAKEKSWGDIPSTDRNGLSQAFMGRLLKRGLTTPQAEQKLAASYWANQA